MHKLEFKQRSFFLLNKGYFQESADKALTTDCMNIYMRMLK